MKKQEQSIFSNPILEALTKTNLFVHIIWYLSVSIAMVLWGYYLSETEITIIAGTFLAGALSWTFIEYIMHRFVFHYISKNKILYRIHYIFHGVHHKYPLDERRTMMPPIPGLLITFIYLGVFYLLLDVYAYYFTGGIILGYLIYSSMHFSMHKYKPPKLLQTIWTHHLIHHFQQSDKAYGVSTTIWDRVFNTMPILKPTKKRKDN